MKRSEFFFVLFFCKMAHFWNIFTQAFEENHRLSMKRTLFGPKPGSDIGVKMWYYVTWRHDMLIVHIFTSMVMLSSLAIVLSSQTWHSCVQRVWVTRLHKCSPDESKCSFEACFEGVMKIQLIVLSSLALPIDYHGRGRWNLCTFGAPRPAGPF